LLYAALLGLVLAVVIAVRPDEDDLPSQTRLSWPTVEVEGLRVPAAGLRPAFSAARAVPAAAAGGVVQLGGVRNRLRLWGVVVDLTGGWLMRADLGEFDRDQLSLSSVRVAQDGTDVCRAASAVFSRADVRFPGLLVFEPRARANSAVDLAVPLPDLLGWLQRSR
jgi:hypothetical protein